MKDRKIVSLLLGGAMTATLLAVPAQAAEDPAQQPYIISVDHWSREDYSQEANPSVFTGAYSQELYNTIRQAMVDGTSEATAYTIVSKEDYSTVKKLIGRMEGMLRYEHHVPQNFTKRYTDITELTPELLRLFIQKIVVHEKSTKWSKHALQTIEIHYNDIGCIGGDIQQDKKSPRQELSA